MFLSRFLCFACLCATSAFATDAYTRFPAIRGNAVVFTAEGDL